MEREKKIKNGNCLGRDLNKAILCTREKKKLC